MVPNALQRADLAVCHSKSVHRNRAGHLQSMKWETGVNCSSQRSCRGSPWARALHRHGL